MATRHQPSHPWGYDLGVIWTDAGFIHTDAMCGHVDVGQSCVQKWCDEPYLSGKGSQFAVIDREPIAYTVAAHMPSLPSMAPSHHKPKGKPVAFNPPGAWPFDECCTNTQTPAPAPEVPLIPLPASSWGLAVAIAALMILRRMTWSKPR